MAQRVLDHARGKIKDETVDFAPRDLLALVDEAVVLLDASPEERITAFAYLVLAIKDERDAQDNHAWPATWRQGRAALYVAAVYVEQYERGSIVNAVA